MVDQMILGWVQAHRIGFLDRWMPPLAAVTGAEAWVVVALLVALLLDYRGHRCEAVWLFGGACIGISLATLIKPLIHRPRPGVGAMLHSWSFPSGHATSSIVTLGLLVILACRRRPGQKRIGWGVGAALVLLVGFNRVYLAAHWPTDVLGGWLIGGGFAYLWARLLPR